MKSSELIGKEVVGSGGWDIGKVTDVNFDTGTWRIISIGVNLEGDVAKEFEMKKLLTKTAIHIEVSSIHSIGDHVMLTLTKPDLQRLAEQHKL